MSADVAPSRRLKCPRDLQTAQPSSRGGSATEGPHPRPLTTQDTLPNHRPLGKIGRAQSELQSHSDLVCRLLLEKKKKKNANRIRRRIRMKRPSGADGPRRTTARRAELTAKTETAPHAAGRRRSESPTPSRATHT